MRFKGLILASSLLIFPLTFHSADASSSYSYHSSSYHSNYSRPSSSFSRPSSTYSKPATTFSKPPANNPPIYHAASSGTTPPPSFSKPSSSGFSKPSPGATSPTVSTFSKPSSNNPTVNPLSSSRSYAPKSALDRALTGKQSKSSLEAYDNEQKKYKLPPYSAPQTKTQASHTYVWRTYGSRYKTSGDYWRERNYAISQYPPPPVYVQNGPSSYGSFYAGFLGGVLLDRITQPSYANFAYSHADDPDFERWRTDMNAQAADNADLRAKLSVMDQQVAALQAANAPKNQALPTGVDPAYAIAPSTAIVATEHSSHTLLYVILFGGIVIVIIGGVGYFLIRRGQRISSLGT